jgi:hypothetical protein
MNGKAIDVDHELATQMRELDDQERRDFIRNHASRIEAAYLQGLVISGRELCVSAPETSWNLARELWNAKPEDC